MFYLLVKVLIEALPMGLLFVAAVAVVSLELLGVPMFAGIADITVSLAEGLWNWFLNQVAGALV